MFAKVNTIFDRSFVWKDDLTAVSAMVGRLSPPERQSLVNLMARSPGSNNVPLLNRWLERVTQRGPAAFDGLDQKAQASLWKQLVVGQDKSNLARIFYATGNQTNPSIQQREYFQMEFANAIAATGTAKQRFDFVNAMRSTATASSEDPATNSSARAIAVVMSATTDPKMISACVKTLGRAGMDAVVQASLPLRDVGSQPGLEPLDTQLFRRLASTMSCCSNSREKAAFVSAAGPLLDSLNSTVLGPNLNRKHLKEVTQAISTVIGTDTTGVIENVMMQNSSEDRSNGPAALKAYARAALDSGNGADLGAITLQLQRGNDLKGDPIKYMAQRESRSAEQPTYVRARVMGGWLGTVGSAVQTRINRRDSNAAYSSLLFTGGVDVMKELVGARFPAFKVAAPALKTAINIGLFNWRNEATKGDRSFAQGLIEGALPRYRNGVESTAEWTQTLKTEQARRFISS